MSGKRSTIVIGSGIAGLLASIQLARSGRSVVLLEQASSLGGLLQSVQNPEGDWFDIGTHVVRDTGNSSADSILFERFEESDWHYIQTLLSGNYAFGALNELSPYIDARHLPEDQYQRGLHELLNLTDVPRSPRNCLEYLDQFFGYTFSREIIGPATERLFDCAMQELAPKANLLFSLVRLLVEDADRSRELKRDELIDQKIGFHLRSDAPTTIRFFYPRRGGVGRWVDLLVAQARDAGVDIRPSVAIGHLQRAEDRIESATLSDGQQIPCETLVWSVAPIALLKLAGITLSLEKPRFRSVSLHHFVFDRPLSTELFYLQNYDPQSDIFRITLYPNLQPETAHATRRYRLTIEVLCNDPQPYAGNDYAARLEADLKRMSVIAPDTKRLAWQSEAIQPGFPVLTTSFVEQNSSINEALSSELSNLVLVGRAAGTSFFMHDVLIETVQRVADLR